MKFVPIWSYDNYVPAHLAMGRLQSEGIECWLKDENTVTIDPLLTNAVGGIKLMVEETRAKEALELLTQLQQEYKATKTCPNCKSNNIELVSTPRKPLTWLTAISSFFLGDYALSVEKVYHCFNCNREFPENATEIKTTDKTGNE
jgi:hypothetical protein